MVPNPHIEASVPDWLWLRPDPTLQHRSVALMVVAKAKAMRTINSALMVVAKAKAMRTINCVYSTPLKVSHADTNRHNFVCVCR